VLALVSVGVAGLGFARGGGWIHLHCGAAFGVPGDRHQLLIDVSQR
jgi:hypothetical protein